MKGTQEFKQTEIGRIPREWEATRLGDIVSLEYGSGLTEAQRKHGRYPVYGSNGVIGYHDNFLLEGPGIVVGRKGTIGAVNWSDSNYWPIDTTYFIDLIDHKIYLRWLYYKLISLNLSRLNTATGTPGLNRDLAYSQTLLLPPLPEQQKIAKILSTADEAIQKVDEAIEKTERLKKGLMQELLTKGIGHKEFKETEIGRIPKEWEVKKLIDIATLQRGHDLPNQQRIEGKYAVIGSNGIAGYHNVYKVRGPGVIIGRSGTLGKVHFVSENYWPLNTSLYVKIFHENLPIFIYYFFQHIDMSQFFAGTGVPTLNRNLLHPIKFAIPNPPEQQKISEILSAVDNRLGLLRKKKEKLERTKQGLMNDLLTGKKRVRLEA